MVSETPRPARARSPEEKTQRRDDILRAAERLWTNTPYADLSMNQVAREAKLAKGTLYLYFDTKEELFLALLTEHLQQWLAHLTGMLAERQPKTSTDVADVIIDASKGYEALRRLLILLGTVLERNVRPELTLNFKRDVRRMLQEVIGQMPFEPELTLKIIVHVYSLAVGWQQITEETPSSETLRRYPEMSFLTLDFDTEFPISVRATIDRLTTKA
ncbi:MAG: TetR family transcriptional regulator [Deinococcus sp.]|nr:TetR family transcriptional regulator [Deinococcus sp.]